MNVERLGAAVHKLWDRAGDGLLGAGLFAASLALYVRTLAPSVAELFADSLEFPLACYDLAIAHPTGYPFYSLLCHLFARGPWRNAAWGVNLLSAVAGALTVMFVYLIARQVTRRRWPALLGAAALAAAPVFWSQSIIAEVYTLNSVFVAALLWLALRWAQQPLLPVRPFSLLLTAPKTKTRADEARGEGWLRLPPALGRWADRLHRVYRQIFPPVPPHRRLHLHWLIFVLALVYAVSLTHHRTMLLLLPALLAFLLLVEWRVLSRAALLGPEHPELPRWRQLAGLPCVLLALCLVVPFLLYLYLPLRGEVGSLDGRYANTWSGFWRWVLASDYGAFLSDNPLARHLDASSYVRLFWTQFGAIGLVLALVGVLGLARWPHLAGSAVGHGNRRALVLTGLAFLFYLGFALLYRVPDVEVFLIPAFLLVAVWIGVGLDYAADLLHPRGPSRGVRRLLATGGLLLVVTAIVQPLAIAVRNYPDLDLSRRWDVHDYGLYLLSQSLPAESSVVGLLGEMTLLRYFQRTIGLRPDVETVAADDEGARRAAVQAALDEGRAVYITRPLPGLTDQVALGAVTGLIDVAGDMETLLRVHRPDDLAPAPPNQVNLELVPGLRLLGFGVVEHRGHSQSWARLRLWWQAQAGLQEPLKVSARLVDAAGQVVAATDAEPVSGAYPTTAWRPGEQVADAYEIPVPAGLPPGEYTPLVIVYEPATGIERGRAELPPVHLEGSPLRPPRRALEASVARPVYALFGDVELLAFTPPNPEVSIHPGEALPLLLLWQARGQPEGRLQLSLWLEGHQEYPVAQVPLGGLFPADRWRDGQTVRQGFSVQVPGAVPAGIYRLRMRVTRDGLPVPWGRGLVPLGGDLDLGSLEIIR